MDLTWATWETLLAPGLGLSLTLRGKEQFTFSLGLSHTWLVAMMARHRTWSDDPQCCRIPTPGTPDVVPIKPLVRNMGAWLMLSSPSRWLLRTIRLGYATQFTRHTALTSLFFIYSPYFIVPKKGGRLRPILDLRVLNQALHRLLFRMLTGKHMITCRVLKLICSDIPEGRILSCLKLSALFSRCGVGLVRNDSTSL